MNDDPNFGKSCRQSAPPSRRVLVLGLFVKMLCYYGWVPLFGILLIAWLLGWGHWRTLLAIGIAGMLLIAMTPAAFGALGAVIMRREAMAKNPPSDE